MKSLLNIILSVSLTLISNESICGQKILSKGKVNFNIEGENIIVNANHVSFARKIINKSIGNVQYEIRRNSILGYDQKKKKPIRNHYELLSNEEVIFEFRKKEIRNVLGADIFIFGKKLGNSIQVFISEDCLNWSNIGEINESIQHLNLDDKIDPSEKFTYLKLVNLNNSDAEIIQVGIIKSNKGNLGKLVEIIDNRIESKSEYVYLRVNDFKEFDGDKISVELNGKSIISKKLLTKWNQFIKLDLNNGKNILTIRAVNEGLKKPNTVDIKIVDGIIFNFGSLRLKKNQKKSIEIIVK